MVRLSKQTAWRHGTMPLEHGRTWPLCFFWAMQTILALLGLNALQTSEKLAKLLLQPGRRADFGLAAPSPRRHVRFINPFHCLSHCGHVLRIVCCGSRLVPSPTVSSLSSALAAAAGVPSSPSRARPPPGRMFCKCRARPPPAPLGSHLHAFSPPSMPN